MSTQFLFPGRKKITMISSIGPEGPALSVSPGAGGLTVGTSGSAPALPSDSAVATPASRVTVYGGVGLSTPSTSNFATWKTWGFTGFCGSYEGTKIVTGSSTPADNGSYPQSFKGTSAINDTIPGPYMYQRAYEGFATRYMNAGATSNTQLNLGVFRARAADPTLDAGITTSLNPQDVTNGTLTTATSTALGNLAAFIKFMGGNQLLLDLEVADAKYAAGSNAQWEAWGYQIGTAIWATAAFPTLEVLVYNWQGQGSWHILTTSNAPPYNPTASLDNQHRAQFLYGMWRAHQAANATARFRFIDAFFYRGTQLTGATLPTALKWNTQGRLAAISQGISDVSVYAHIMPLLDIDAFHWAGTDADGYYTNSQQGEAGSFASRTPWYGPDLEQYRQFSMGGARAEFCFAGDINKPGTPGVDSTHGGNGLWAGGNNYLTATGRLALMQSAASTSASYSTSVPTITTPVASGRSGSNITLTFSAAHAYGIRGVAYKVYASNGTTLLTSGAFRMTFNRNGGTPTTGIPTSTMDMSQQIVAATGTFVVITAYSTLAQPPTGQQHSVLVSL